MGVEIGDSIAVDGRAGEVVGFDAGRVIVRPFPIAEQQNTPGQPECFVAVGELVILKKHFERTTDADRSRMALEQRVNARAAQFRAEFYEAAVHVDRAWHRQR